MLHSTHLTKGENLMARSHKKRKASHKQKPEQKVVSLGERTHLDVTGRHLIDNFTKEVYFAKEAHFTSPRLNPEMVLATYNQKLMERITVS